MEKKPCTWSRFWLLSIAQKPQELQVVTTRDYIV